MHTKRAGMDNCILRKKGRAAVSRAFFYLVLFGNMSVFLVCLDKLAFSAFQCLLGCGMTWLQKYDPRTHIVVCLFFFPVCAPAPYVWSH